MLTRAQQRAQAGEFPGAIELIEMVEHNTLREEKVKTFTASNEFKAADKLVLAEIGKCRTSLQKLVTALETAGDTKGTAWKDRAEEIKALEERWNQTKGFALDADDLGAANYVKQLQVLAAEFERIASDPKAAAGILKQAQIQAEIKALDEATKAVNTALEELAGHDRGTQFESHVKERDRIEDGAPDKAGSYAAAIEAMNTLKGKIETTTQTAIQAHGTVVTEFNEKKLEVANAIKDLKSAAQKSLQPKNRKFFEPYFEEVDADFLALSDIGNSPGTSAVKMGIVELGRVLKRVEQIKADMSGNVGTLKELVGNALGKNDPQQPEPEEFDPDVLDLSWLFGEDEETGEPKLSEKVKATFQLVVAALKDLGEQLKNDNLTTTKPTLQRLLSEDFTQLSSNVKGLEPADGLKALFVFQKQLTEAQTSANTAAEKRNTFNTVHKPQAKAAYKELTTFEPEARLGKLFKDQKEFYGELAKEYIAAKSLIEEENKEQEATNKMIALKEKIAKAKIPSEALVMEREAQARKHQAEKDKEQWDMYVSEYERITLPAVREAMKVDGADKTQLKDCENLLKKAKDAFKNTQELNSSLAMLGLARDRAEVAIKFPLGTAATARNELPKSVTRWKNAVTAFNRSIDAVINKMEEVVSQEGYSVKPDEDEDEEGAAIRELFAEEGDIEKAAKVAGKTLTGLKRLFDANVFDKPAAVMQRQEG